MPGRKSVYDDFVFIRPVYPHASIKELSTRLGIDERTGNRYNMRYKRECIEQASERREMRRRAWERARTREQTNSATRW
jgi:hypothetical protein